MITQLGTRYEDYEFLISCDKYLCNENVRWDAGRQPISTMEIAHMFMQDDSEGWTMVYTTPKKPLFFCPEHSENSDLIIAIRKRVLG